jgi:hypothetical protein
MGQFSAQAKLVFLKDWFSKDSSLNSLPSKE